MKTSGKRQKTFGILTFSGITEMEHWAKIGQGALEITLEVLLNGVIKLWEKLYRDKEELVSSDLWLKHQVKLTKFLFSSNIYLYKISFQM